MSKGFITGTNEELIKAYKESRDESYLKRSGAKGSLKTTYQYFPKDPSEMEIPEPQNLVGSLILDLDREDQIKAIEGRLQLNKGNNNDSNNDSGAGATRVF